MAANPPSQRSYSRNSYTIAWISALPHEQTAAIGMLDNQHARPHDFIQSPNDSNSYSWGDINSFNVVIASLPAGEYGTASAAGTAVTTLLSFPQVRFGLMVGIGAGVPRPGRDVRLGDIVVSRPEGTSGGVVQYDFGKALQGGEFRRTGFLNSPPRVLRSAITNLQAQHGLQESKIPQYLDQMVNRFPRLGQPTNDGPSYTYQGVVNDRLFNPTYPHEGGNDCLNCDPTQLQRRVKRNSTNPVIHYGVIASGNMLIRDPEVRAEMVRRTGEDCICFEMEAAGLMNQFPCLVIRGICDYADSHKNDEWQRYAAATAAAYTKELIGLLPAQAVAETDTAAGIVNPGQTPTPNTNTTPNPATNAPPGPNTTPGQTTNSGQSPSNSEIQQLRDDVAGLSRQMNTVIQMLQSSPPNNSGSGSGGTGSSGGGASGGSVPGGGTSGRPEGTHAGGNRWYGFSLAEQVEAAQRRNPERFRDDLVGAITFIGSTVHNWRADQNSVLAQFFETHSIRLRFTAQEPGSGDEPLAGLSPSSPRRLEFVCRNYRAYGGMNEHFCRVFTLWRIAVEFMGME
ncbi:nucleoside phosphorylase domain-containing protein [Trichoderma velutinum]